MGATIKTRKGEDGRFVATSPNYPELRAVEADSSSQAVAGFQRRLRAFGASNMNVDKANAADVSGTSRDKLTCG